MAGLKEITAERRRAARAEGPAAILGIGTAVPPNVMQQSEYPDFLFRTTGSEDKTELKETFRGLCQKTAINKRHMYLTEQLLAEQPSLASYMDASLNVRQEIAKREVPKLAAEASLRAIQDWGRPSSEITHVVMATNCGGHMPGPEVELIKLLGLRPDTKRVMMFLQGWFAGATVVRVARDLAENNAGARVLAVTSELTVAHFRAPSPDYLSGLLGAAVFGDGAAAVVVGADPRPQLERPIFELEWSGMTLLPDSEGTIHGSLTEAGLTYHLGRDVPSVISKNIHQFLSQAVTEAGLTHSNNNESALEAAAPGPGTLSFDDMFWVVHPGGAPILDTIETRLQLSRHKLTCSRHVLAEYGNMWSASVLFVLDNMRHRSKDLGFPDSGEGCRWGFLIACGAGFTVEVSILKSCPL